MSKNNKNLSVSLHCKERYVERFKGVANQAVSVLNKAFKGAVEIDSDRQAARRWLNREKNMILVTDDFIEVIITVYKWKEDNASIPMIADEAFLKVIEDEFSERTKRHYTKYFNQTVERARLTLELNILERDMFDIWLEDRERFNLVRSDLIERVENLKSKLQRANEEYDTLNSEFSKLCNNVSAVVGRDLRKECGKLFFIGRDNHV